MKDNCLRLGVNIDHVATLREARRTDYPDVVAAAGICKAAGAGGITVHLREDRRHIHDRDVYALRKAGDLPLNLEMADSPEIVKIALDVGPDEVCIVPEKREELTTEGGLDVAMHSRALSDTTRRLRNKGVLVSLFIDPERKQIEASAGVGATYVELHTGSFCDSRGENAAKELDRLIDGAAYARKLGLNVNAGHGINLDNIDDILKIPHLDTLNIGHSIVSRAVFVGLHRAVAEMLEKISCYDGGRT
jgi:pyridoxine 5-phosphate synthase